MNCAHLHLMLSVSHSSVLLTLQAGSGVPMVGMGARNALVLTWTCPSRVSYPGAAGPELVERRGAASHGWGP